MSGGDEDDYSGFVSPATFWKRKRSSSHLNLHVVLDARDADDAEALFGIPWRLSVAASPEGKAVLPDIATRSELIFHLCFALPLDSDLNSLHLILDGVMSSRISVSALSAGECALSATHVTLLPESVTPRPLCGVIDLLYRSAFENGGVHMCQSLVDDQPAVRPLASALLSGASDARIAVFELLLSYNVFIETDVWLSCFALLSLDKLRSPISWVPSLAHARAIDPGSAHFLDRAEALATNSPNSARFIMEVIAPSSSLLSFADHRRLLLLFMATAGGLDDPRWDEWLQVPAALKVLFSQSDQAAEVADARLAKLAVRRHALELQRGVAGALQLCGQYFRALRVYRTDERFEKTVAVLRRDHVIELGTLAKDDREMALVLSMLAASAHAWPPSAAVEFCRKVVELPVVEDTVLKTYLNAISFIWDQQASLEEDKKLVMCWTAPSACQEVQLALRRELSNKIQNISTTKGDRMDLLFELAMAKQHALLFSHAVWESHRVAALRHLASLDIISALGLASLFGDSDAEAADACLSHLVTTRLSSTPLFVNGQLAFHCVEHWKPLVVAIVSRRRKPQVTTLGQLLVDITHFFDAMLANCKARKVTKRVVHLWLDHWADIMQLGDAVRIDLTQHHASARECMTYFDYAERVWECISRFEIAWRSTAQTLPPFSYLATCKEKCRFDSMLYEVESALPPRDFKSVADTLRRLTATAEQPQFAFVARLVVGAAADFKATSEGAIAWLSAAAKSIGFCSQAYTQRTVLVSDVLSLTETSANFEEDIAALCIAAQVAAGDRDAAVRSCVNALSWYEVRNRRNEIFGALRDACAPNVESDPAWRVLFTELSEPTTTVALCEASALRAARCNHASELTPPAVTAFLRCVPNAKNAIEWLMRIPATQTFEKEAQLLNSHEDAELKRLHRLLISVQVARRWLQRLGFEEMRRPTTSHLAAMLATEAIDERAAEALSQVERFLHEIIAGLGDVRCCYALVWGTYSPLDFQWTRQGQPVDSARSTASEGCYFFRFCAIDGSQSRRGGVCSVPRPRYDVLASWTDSHAAS